MKRILSLNLLHYDLKCILILIYLLNQMEHSRKDMNAEPKVFQVMLLLKIVNVRFNMRIIEEHYEMIFFVKSNFIEFNRRGSKFPHRRMSKKVCVHGKINENF